MSHLREIAESYVGTPHVNACDIKGVGLDCCTLPAKVLGETYGINFVINLNYPADWYCRRGCEEILLPYLRMYCDQIRELEEGAILSYEWARAKYAHLALYLGEGEVIHSNADTGVEITSVNSSCFLHPSGKSRLTGIWRLKHGLI